MLLDVYHSLGVFPVDSRALDVDFAVGGSYKYLRGGPGACFLYVAPRHLDAGVGTLDIGWFAKESPFAYARPGSAALRRRRRRVARIDAGGAAVLPGARRADVRAGGGRGAAARAFAQRSGDSLRCSPSRDVAQGAAGRGSTSSSCAPTPGMGGALEARGIVTDARGEWLRMCPEC